VLVDSGDRHVRQVERVAAPQHRFGECGGLATIETADIAGHEKRGHLIVRDVPGRVGACQRVPLTGLDTAAVPLSLDQARRKHH
jgi:hypothetical protein